MQLQSCITSPYYTPGERGHRGRDPFESVSIPKVRANWLETQPSYPGITIDPANPAEIDDAIWIAPDEHGFIIHVSIAAPSVVVDAGSLIDRIARERCGSRYYGPTIVNPMLPHELAANDLSFLAGENRPAITISIPYFIEHQKGWCAGEPKIEFSALKSAKQFSYEEVDTILTSKHSEFSDMLDRMLHLAIILNESRRLCGASAYSDMQHGMMRDENGRALFVPTKRVSAYMIVHEFMILANTTMANYFCENEILGLYRNHTNDGKFSWRAFYDPNVMGHAALGVEAYMHFTSPLRRYPDLLNQMALKNFLEDQRALYQLSELEDIALRMNGKLQTIGMSEGAANALARGGQKDGVLEQLQFLRSESVADLMKEAIKSRQTGKPLYPETLRNEILRRLQNGNLNPQCFFLLLHGDGSDNSKDLELQQQALSWLKANPTKASDALTPLIQNYGGSLPQLKKTLIAEKEEWSFLLSTHFRRDGTVIEGSGQAASKIEALEQASLAFWDKILIYISLREGLAG